MAQLECMDARLDTFSDKLCQVHMGGFVASPSPSPSPQAFEDRDDDDGFGDDEDEDASSSSDEKMTASQ
ncbi:hypothetical protein SO802_019529 [Lithocarpus litseifolius]|uniref:Uncharacterized protein n=1 Tax=Lithocarpus litseifolius TaxID=425828 RepID=A0AAW2CR54_9ROSI